MDVLVPKPGDPEPEGWRKTLDRLEKGLWCLLVGGGDEEPVSGHVRITPDSPTKDARFSVPQLLHAARTGRLVLAFLLLAFLTVVVFGLFYSLVDPGTDEHEATVGHIEVSCEVCDYHVPLAISSEPRQTPSTNTVVYLEGETNGDDQRTRATCSDLQECLYFSVVTFTSLGYGDLQPARGAHRLVAAVQAFSGVLFIGLAGGLVVFRLQRSRDALVASGMCFWVDKDRRCRVKFAIRHTAWQRVGELHMDAFLRHKADVHRTRHYTELDVYKAFVPIFWGTWEIDLIIPEVALEDGDGLVSRLRQAFKDGEALVVSCAGTEVATGARVFGRSEYFFNGEECPEEPEIGWTPPGSSNRWSLGSTEPRQRRLWQQAAEAFEAPWDPCLASEVELVSDRTWGRWVSVAEHKGGDVWTRFQKQFLGGNQKDQTRK